MQVTEPRVVIARARKRPWRPRRGGAELAMTIPVSHFPVKHVAKGVQPCSVIS
jgi:hypothetical protein